MFMQLYLYDFYLCCRMLWYWSRRAGLHGAVPLNSLRSPVMDDENVRPVGDTLILALLRASSLQRTCTTYPKVAPGPGAISKWVSK